MTESNFHELVLVGLNVGGNVIVWRYLLPDRELLALVVFVTITVYPLAKRWRNGLAYVA